MKDSAKGLKKLVDDHFEGNMNTCARVLDVAPSTIWRVVKGNSTPGIKLISRITHYCKRKNIDSSKYIFFD